MRVLHLTPYYAPAYAFGGVVRSAEAMALSLAERGHQVTVLTTDAHTRRARYAGPLEEDRGGVRVIRCPNLVPGLRRSLNLSTPRGMWTMLAALLPGVDLLHLHEFRTAENLLAIPLAQALELPVLLSPHGTLDLGAGRGLLKAGWDRVFGAGIAKGLNHVIALTENERRDAELLWTRFGLDRRPCSVIPNGVRLDDLANLPTRSAAQARLNLDDRPTVLYLGRLQARKNVDILIEAFRLADVTGAQLLIAGPDEGQLARLRALAGGDGRIVFAGYLEGEARLAALSASDVFALAATGEGQPMAALEAMAAGLPLLLSHGCNMDEVERAGAGVVAEATVAAFAAGLRRLLGDAELRTAMGARGRQLVAEKYALGTVAESLVRAYQSLM